MYTDIYLSLYTYIYIYIYTYPPTPPGWNSLEVASISKALTTVTPDTVNGEYLKRAGIL